MEEQIIKILPRYKVPVVMKRSTKKRTHEEYVAELAVKNPNVEVVGQYINARTPILHKCLKHNIEWEVIPDVVLRGHGCQKCKGEKIRNNLSKSNIEYINELKIKNPNIIPLEEYINANTDILHKCLIDKYEWKTSPYKLLSGTKCPLCSKRNNIRKRTHEQYIEQVALINTNIKVIGQYIDDKTPILHECIIHNYQWNTTPGNILSGHGCIKCAREYISKIKRKNICDYIDDVKKINNNILPIGEYINAHTPLLHKCLIDDYEWYAEPNNILAGKGCPKCSGRVRRTQKDYIDELKKINQNIEVLEEYINVTTPILHKCKKHNIQWIVAPYNILNSNGCRECSKEKIGEKNRKSHIQYLEDLKNKNSNIEVLEEYINSYTPILHKCLIDNYEWNAAPSNILSGTGCPKCAGNIRMTQKEYIEKVFSVNKNIEVLGEYVNANTPILHKCLMHNIEWKISPSNVLKGCGCKECLKEKLHKNAKTHEQYVEELKNINPYIEVIGTYVDAKTPILHRCLIDNNEWYTNPCNILYSNCGCPKCNESSGERKVRLWLEKNNISYIYQMRFKNCRDINVLPFDFYLPTYNLCIEYDDKQHFEPIKFFGGEEKFILQQKHDKIKNEYCENNGISLLRIPYYKNVEEELNNFLFI